jgi:SAM-dependent methyltransferase
MASHACEICGNSHDNRRFTAREMMFGSRERFDYIECSECGCLQLTNVPNDLSRFYPDEYYSFRDGAQPMGASLTVVAKRVRTAVLLRTPLGVVDAFGRMKRIPPHIYALTGLGLSTSSAICDLGSGNGQGVLWLLSQGLSNVTGFDPYAREERVVDQRLVLRKGGVDDLPGGWDLIMLHHSFEHMAAPAVVLKCLRERLNDRGSLVIRIPVADSFACRFYGADWVQLDPPRHLFIHTQRSIHVLANRTRLAVSRVFFDSHALQFWGSEQYKRDIPLRDPRSYYENTRADLFSASQIRGFQRQADRLNRRGWGDSAGFVLRRV